MVESTDFSCRLGSLVAGDVPEFDLGIDGEVAKKIDDKEDAAFEEGDDGEGAIAVVFADGAGEGADTPPNPWGGKVGLPGGAGHLPAAVGVNWSSSWLILAVSGPEIFRSRPFCQELRAFFSSSSWAKQRPA